MRFNKLPPAEIEEILREEESLSPEPYRADGRLRCVQCGFLFRQHPFSAIAAGGDSGEMGISDPIYRLLCNGSLVKL